jgi:NAD(P)-dependent dehydrogenase (short-subunit alcohol dehydrogenase family)
MENPLVGKVAIVTGGGRGLGKAFALALAERGAKVALTARSADQVEQTVTTITERGGQAIGLAGDVTDPDAVSELVGKAESEFGPVDLLINNAGVATPIGPVARTDADDWWRAIEINLRGPFLYTRAVIRPMMTRKQGRIINVASGAGTMTIPFLSSYCTSKAALIRFTDILAAEVKDAGISVFAIEPGTVRTTMAEGVLQSEEGKKWLPWFERIFEAGQDVPPDHAVQLVLFLASGKADALSGRFIDVREDIPALVESAEKIALDDLYTLRLRRPL